MATVPHQFEKLTSREEKAVLMVGAGMSRGLVPMANDLKDPLELAAKNLSIEDDELSTTSDPYKYADILLKHIPNQNKLALVQNMGILNDPKWFAKVGLPLRGSTPRHRVIARFARENLLYEIWNYNWDTVLESAFDAVGFTRGRQDEIRQPWNTLFDCLITIDDLTATPTDGFFQIYKPHGCLYAMTQAQELIKTDSEKSKRIADQFMIGQNELTLNTQWTEQEPGKTFLSKLHTSLNHHVIIIGWSLPEGYVKNKLSEQMQPIQAKQGHLSIIDPFFNEEGHTTICQRYQLNQNDTHFAVDPAQKDLTTNDLFLALQAKYSLKQLLNYTDEGSAEYETIQTILEQCDVGNAKKGLIHWADNFLPAWIRLCWRTGHLEVRNFNAQDLRLEKPDVHIPYQGIEGTRRIDMEMAAVIFNHIQKSNVDWDYATFPGGLWDYRHGRLILPLPNTSFEALHAIRPLLKMIEEKMAYISCIVIMPVTHSTLSNTTNIRLRDSIKHLSTKPQLMRDAIWKYTENLVDDKDIS